MALSQDEQRILDEMERNLAADDPRLAARLGSFGQPRLPGQIKMHHARTIGGVLALALIAAVTVMVFLVSPFANHVRNGQGPRGTPSAAARTTPSSRTTSARTAGSSNSATGSAVKTPAVAKDAKGSGALRDAKNSTAPRR